MNYKKIVLIVLFLSLSTYAHAGYYVFHSGETITGKSVCGKACRVRPDSISVDKTIFDSITRWHKVVGGVVVLMTQAEKDAIIQAETDARIQAQNDAVDNLEVSVKDLGRALVQLGIVDGAMLKAKIKEIKGL